MKVLITQSTGALLTLGFGGADAPASLAAVPVETGPAGGDMALIERGGRVLKMPTPSLVAPAGPGWVGGGWMWPMANLATINASYAVPERSNALSIGPLTLAPGVVLTVPATSTYRVI
jgi:hypothetical protein